MTRRLILHIGAHRTATTSLQACLNANSGALAKRGVLYPYKARRHLKLFNALFSGDRQVSAVAQELAEMADRSRQPIDTLILSDEDICTRRDLSVLGAFRDHFDVEIVYTLRRQDLWLESWYFQNVKWQWQKPLSHCTFPEFMAERGRFHWIDYDRFLGKLERIFGPEAIRPQVYEKGQMPEGPVTAFFRLTGIDPEGLKPPSHMNPSFTPKTTEFMRQLPLDEAETGYRNVLTRLCAHVNNVSKQEGKPSTLLLDPEERARLMESFAPGNAAVAERYFDRETLFFDPLPPADAPLADLALPADSASLIEGYVGPFLRFGLKHSDDTLAGPEHASPELSARIARFHPEPAADLPSDSATLMREEVAPMVSEMIRNAHEKRLVRTSSGKTAAKATVLQSLILPVAGLPDAPGLCLRPLPGAAAPVPSGGGLDFGPGAGAAFDSWMNLFNADTWARVAPLNQLQLTLEGQGEVEVALFATPADGPAIRCLTQACDLSEGPCRLPCPDPAKAPGTLWFEIRTGDTAARLDAARWETADAPRRTPDLALCITTYRREAETEATLARLAESFGDEPRVQVIVTDNGGTLPPREGPRLSLRHSPNLGGSGGFARGLLEARARGASHALFMDDDAVFHPEALRRTLALLAYAEADETAVSGAMIDAARPAVLWENGARFHLTCRAIGMGTDLADPEEARELEARAARPDPAQVYSGWWFFAFPLAAVIHLPFPFFVRGDDVSFSLANDFRRVTLPGVAAFQENFTDKESPLTWYLDLRSHLAHHLSLPRLAVSRLALARVIASFAMRCGLRMHYDSLAALSLALDDVLAGPEAVAAQGDLSERRARIAALTGTETWGAAPSPPRPDRIRLDPHSWPMRALSKLTLNGHLLPGFALIGNRITIEADDRGWLRAAWGAAEITYLSRDRGRAYTVRHSKARAWREGLRLAGRTLTLLRRYPALVADWRAAYPRLTSEAFWTDRLGLK
ncbi:glycosyltransferase [Litorisediminicola beolgyonensis]|uniref:Glycosyltransferase n=1 Tax=Litorisediminicola beolgyonensis TaxID=1173614 RepID=A0ABW3ZP05_9RHOB